MAFGDVATLTPVADTALWQLDPDYNLGGQRDLPAGTLGGMGSVLDSRILMRFDVAAAIPAGSTITGATLRWTVTNAPDSGAVDSTFTFHRLLAAWNEGTGRGDIPGGRTAVAGESTWNRQAHPDGAWSAPGTQSGAEFEADASASAFIQREKAYSFTFNAKGIADLQAMIAEPARNFGWLVKSEREGTAKTARRFASRESLTTPVPQLEITFTPPPAAPPPPVITGFAVDADAAELRFLALAGVAYRVESTRSLDPETWEPEEDFPAAEAGERVFTDPAIEGVTLKFYRVAATAPQG